MSYRNRQVQLATTLALALLLARRLPAEGAEEAKPSAGELALVEIVSWGPDTCEAGRVYHTGFLYAQTIESKGNSLPARFKLSFKRKLSGGEGSTPWNALPERAGGMLGIHTSEWLVGYFTKVDDVWTVLPGGELLDLARPEDLSPERLRLVQAKFTTPLIRVWVPETDVLADVMKRIKWRMPVAEFRKAFQDTKVSDDKWSLDRGSFRNRLSVTYANTKTAFEFSGVVDQNGKEDVPVSSSLIGFSIHHPVKPRPDCPFTRPPNNPHYQYIRRLHDQYARGLRHRGMKFEGEQCFGASQGYMVWERCSSRDDGTLTFVYWSLTQDEGITAEAPKELIAADLAREREAAMMKTRFWPIPRCGNDIEFRMLPRR
jgi:hypothetical protein